MQEFDYNRVPIIGKDDCMVIGLDRKKNEIYYVTNHLGTLSYKKATLEK